VQVLGLGLLDAGGLNSVEHSQLRNVEQDLAPVVLAVLHWIDAEVDLCEQWKVLDMSELIDFANVVHADVHKLQTLDHFEATESSNLIL